MPVQHRVSNGLLPLGGSVAGSFIGPTASILGSIIPTALSTEEAKAEPISLTIIAIAAGIGAIYGGLKANAGSCQVFQPVTRSDRCEECHSNPFIDCVEYTCRSLGQNCEYFPDEQRCLETQRDDSTPPQIEFCDSANAETETQLNVEHTNNLGCEIIDEVAEFETFAVKVSTNEEAQCRFGQQVGFSYSEGASYGEGGFATNHYFVYAIGDTSVLPEEACKAGKACNFYIKCQDRWGNIGERDYNLKFTLREGLDINPPDVVQLEVGSGSQVKAGNTETEFAMYVHDRTGVAECRWSQENDEYDDMENIFECDSVIDAQVGGFRCDTKLTDIATTGETPFYFKCQDSSPQQNKNTQSIDFTLGASTDLEYRVVRMPRDGEKRIPNLVPVQLSTDKDADCTYQIDGGQITRFDVTGTNDHQDTLEFKDGSHTLRFSCVDHATNTIEEERTFSVEKDTRGPIVIRMLSKPNFSGRKLVLITDEPANCKYSNDRSDFIYAETPEQGVHPLLPQDGLSIQHESNLNPGQPYHVLCQDGNGILGGITSIYP